MKLVYSQEALQDLVRLRQFIAEHHPAAAQRIARELVVKIENLRLFPEMGRAVALSPTSNIRDLMVGSYQVRYVYQPHSLTILRIWHHLEER